MNAVHADEVARERKAEARAGFMRAYVIACVRSGRVYGPTVEIEAGRWNRCAANDAREAWEIIEIEAAK